MGTAGAVAAPQFAALLEDPGHDVRYWAEEALAGMSAAVSAVLRSRGRSPPRC